MIEFTLRGIALRIETALIDGAPANAEISHAVKDGVHRIDVRADGTGIFDRIGVRIVAVGAAHFLRNGWHSWDGSEFIDAGVQPVTGYAMTALLPQGEGAAIAGFERHDRFQTQLRFSARGDALVIDAETLLDATGAREGETLLLFEDSDVQEAMRRWSRAVATASPLPARVPGRQITGWCSWYNLYAAIDAQSIRDHLAGARQFRARHGVRLDVFLIDDGFTPEMGDWLDVKPQFPDGMQTLITEIADAGFVPGLWIAPFIVGNRSKLFAAHPDWVVGDRRCGGPLVAMRYYGEFRWHKRSEEYYVLDITNPLVERYIAEVLRVWAHEWGARYFKTDFMYFGMEWGADRAIWHTPGQSRVAVWRKMAATIRSAIGDDAIWSGCGAPLWASVGFFDANRIGRDIGVRMTGGEQSAESLLRDHATRSHANGILWQADPDCILLRDRFHELSDSEVERLARVAAETGGVLMTSDHLGELSQPRQTLFADILRAAD